MKETFPFIWIVKNLIIPCQSMNKLQRRMTEKLSLTWKDFQSNISNTFRRLRSEEELFDVHLLSDDQVRVEHCRDPRLI